MYPTKKTNKRKTAPRVKEGYLTRKERKAVEYYERMRKERLNHEK